MSKNIDVTQADTNKLITLLNFVNKMLDEAKDNDGYIGYELDSGEYNNLCDSYNEAKNLTLKILELKKL